MKGCKCTLRLSAISLGLEFGIVTGLWMMLFAWSAMWWGHGIPMIAQWAEVYHGYAPTYVGGLIGGAWGFAEGFISGLIFGLIYNLCSCCCKCMCKSGESCDTAPKSSKK